MKRKIFLLLAVIVLIFSFTLPVHAEDTTEPELELELDPNEAFLNELAEFVDKCGDQGKSTIVTQVTVSVPKA